MRAAVLIFFQKIVRLDQPVDGPDCRLLDHELSSKSALERQQWQGKQPFVGLSDTVHRMNAILQMLLQDVQVKRSIHERIGRRRILQILSK